MKIEQYREVAIDGIQPSYPPALLDFYDTVLVGFAGTMGDKLEDFLPKSNGSRIPLIKYLHMHSEKVVAALHEIGVDEWKDSYELILLSQEYHDAAIKDQQLSIPTDSNIEELSTRLFEKKYSVSEKIDNHIRPYKSQSSPEATKETPLMKNSIHLHNLAGAINILYYDEEITRPELNDLLSVERYMRAAAKIVNNAHKASDSLGEVGEIIGQWISQEWHGRIETLFKERQKLLHSKGIDPNTDKILNALRSCNSVFCSILGKEEPSEVFSLVSFVEGQLPTLQHIAHNARPGLKLNIIFDDIRDDQKRPLVVEGIYSQMIILLRNLVHDAVVHGDYEDDSVDIHLTIGQEIGYGAAMLTVSNPVFASVNQLEMLTAHLGHTRVILDEAG